MIKTLSDMLLAFMEKESNVLAGYNLQHGPSIGDMYEGLSTKILETAIPKDLDLKVVSGFIVNAEGVLSGQIDCMLVTGEGEKIPYSQAYKWPIWDVLAVVEVKKTLYGAELADSFNQLREVAKAFSNWLFADGVEKRSFCLAPAMQAFSTITGVQAPRYSGLKSLSEPLQLIYHTLVAEQLSPLLIVWGYNGYTSETGLREGLYRFIDDRESGQGYGIPSFPHQITCNGSSLVKLIGQPYMTPMEDDFWSFYASTRANPLWVLIELIWTKIANRFRVSMPWGDDLDVEVLNRFISAKAAVENGKGGWVLNYTAMKAGNNAPISYEAWSPYFVTSAQFVVFNRLCNEEYIDINDADFVAFIEARGQSVTEFIAGLRKTGFVALDKDQLKLTTVEMMCGIFPEGGYAVGENNTGRMTRYLQRKIRERKA